MIFILKYLKCLQSSYDRISRSGKASRFYFASLLLSPHPFKILLCCVHPPVSLQRTVYVQVSCEIRPNVAVLLKAEYFVCIYSLWEILDFV